MDAETGKKLKDILAVAKKAVLFTGAGFSVPSGIPDFRSPGGLYSRKFGGMSAEYMLSHEFFAEHTAEFYGFYRKYMLYPDARPNAAHRFFAGLERAGKLAATVTQNIDGLHFKAGARNVWELHGSTERYTCMKCGAQYDAAYISAAEGVPLCGKCGGTVRPDVVLYGENLDGEVIAGALEAVADADTLIVAGTSLSVYPAAAMPDYFRGDTLVIVNKSVTPRDADAALVVRDGVENVFDEKLLKEVLT